MAHGERWVFDGQTDRQTDRQTSMGAHFGQTPAWVKY